MWSKGDIQVLAHARWRSLWLYLKGHVSNRRPSLGESLFCIFLLSWALFVMSVYFVLRHIEGLYSVLFILGSHQMLKGLNLWCSLFIGDKACRDAQIWSKFLSSWIQLKECSISDSEKRLWWAHGERSLSKLGFFSHTLIIFCFWGPCLIPLISLSNSEW